MFKKITLFIPRWFHVSISQNYVPSIKIRGWLERLGGSCWPIWCTVTTKYVSEDSRDSNGVPTVCTPILYKLSAQLSLINSHVVTLAHCLKIWSGARGTGAAHRQPGSVLALTGCTRSGRFYLFFLSIQHIP